MQGRLIVFEGTDGSGKATQTALLCKELDQRGIPYRKLEFPRYKEESSALIRLYLSGAFGAHPDDVNAYAATAFYSVDRFASYRQDWGAFYESGGLVMPKEEREGYLKWLFDFEYRLLELPEPDRVVYLDLPTELSEQMMRRREQATGTKADIHEQDEGYLAACRESAELVISLCGWEKIDCSRGGAVRTPEDIHREVLARVEDLLVPRKG